MSKIREKEHTLGCHERDAVKRGSMKDTLSLNKRAVRIPLESILVTVRNEVAKVMFLHLSVCQQGEGSAPLHAGISPLSEADTTPRHTSSPRQIAPWPEADTPHGQTPPGQRQTPPRETSPLVRGRHPPVRGRHPRADGYCCGRCVSYWNAFSFINLILPVLFQVPGNLLPADEQDDPQGGASGRQLHMATSGSHLHPLGHSL